MLKQYSLLFIGLFIFLSGCAENDTITELPVATGQERHTTNYKIAPGDGITIFVWRNPEISTEVIVRPDGFISAPLLEEVPAAGKTAIELAKDVTQHLKKYLKDPLVSIIINGFKGTYQDQVRVIGEATNPRAMLYQDAMTLLDVMIAVGGLTQFADGDRAILVRKEDDVLKEYRVRLSSLLKKGDPSANVDMKPGDIIIIPEAWF